MFSIFLVFHSINLQLTKFYSGIVLPKYPLNNNKIILLKSYKFYMNMVCAARCHIFINEFNKKQNNEKSKTEFITATDYYYFGNG